MSGGRAEQYVVGVGVSGLSEGYRQMNLWEDADQDNDQRLQETLDELSGNMDTKWCKGVLEDKRLKLQRQNVHHEYKKSTLFSRPPDYAACSGVLVCPKRTLTAANIAFPNSFANIYNYH